MCVCVDSTPVLYIPLHADSFVWAALSIVVVRISCISCIALLPHLSLSLCVCRDQRPATGGEGDSDDRTQAQGVLVKERSGTGAAGAAGAATGAAAGATAGAATDTIPGAAAGGTSASAGHVCSRRTRPPRPHLLGERRLRQMWATNAMARQGWHGRDGTAGMAR